MKKFMFKKISKSALGFAVGTSLALNLSAQEQVEGFVHEQSAASDYVYPTDPQVLEKLDRWQDQKFGVLLHWGLYSVPGIVESWSICSEDEDWISRKNGLPYDEYKKWYWGLIDSLNPVDFNPEQWAEVMADAGMKYMIFTTKHHDGFCLFDSKYTDFSIAHGAFKDHPRRNAALHVFEAFRQRGSISRNRTGIASGFGILISQRLRDASITRKNATPTGGQITSRSPATNWTN